MAQFGIDAQSLRAAILKWPASFRLPLKEFVVGQLEPHHISTKAKPGPRTPISQVCATSQAQENCTDFRTQHRSFISPCLCIKVEPKLSNLRPATLLLGCVLKVNIIHTLSITSAGAFHFNQNFELVGSLAIVALCLCFPYRLCLPIHRSSGTFRRAH